MRTEIDKLKDQLVDSELNAEGWKLAYNELLAKKECFHYWETGYVAEPIIFCTRCDKELDQVYEADLYRTHTAKDGYLVPKSDAAPYIQKPKPKRSWFRRLWDDMTDENFQF